MKLNEKTKEYISMLVNVIGGYETYEDLGIEAILSIKLMGDYDINDIDLKKQLNNFIKRLVKENKGQVK
jgi:hypothetical protein